MLAGNGVPGYVAKRHKKRTGQRRGEDESKRAVKHKRSFVEIQYTFCKSASHNEEEVGGNDDDDDNDGGLCDKWKSQAEEGETSALNIEIKREETGTRACDTFAEMCGPRRGRDFR